MIYIIITACIIKNINTRESQYKRCIEMLKMIPNVKLVVVENNGFRYTFLDELEIPVIYTYNNSIHTKNIGRKEIKDVNDVIKILNIKDDDFIVKITGRYILDNDSHFIEKLKSVDDEKIDCILKYGSYANPVDFKMRDCVTGLIGMRCKYVKLIKVPEEDEAVEWLWADVAMTIPDEHVYVIKRPYTLGISICPGSDSYFHI